MYGLYALIIPQSSQQVKKGTKQNRKIAAAILVKPKPLQKEP